MDIMRRDILNILKLFIVLSILFVWMGCSSEDDVEGIFVGKTWCVNYMFKADGKTAAFTDEEKEMIDGNRENYCIVFGQETFNVKSGDYTFGGKWSVDGKKHTINFMIDGNVVPPNSVSRKIADVIKEAVKYEGDYDQLRIYTSTNTSILFRPLK